VVKKHHNSNVDGFAKSPSAVLRSSLVTAAYLHVRLIPQLSQALHLELFAVPSQQREFANASILIRKCRELTKKGTPWMEIPAILQ
jgi:hypothetical protein